MNPATINEFEVAYARFNARKTFATTEPSQFEHQRFGGLDVTRDGARSDSYYNRILGLTTQPAGELDAAIEWIRAGTTADQPIRVDISIGAGADNSDSDWLAGLGWRHVDTLVWLHAPPATRAELRSHDEVRPLTTQDWPALRRLLEQQGAIADAVWAQKRRHLCTETFRWVGIFDCDVLISAASTWITDAVAVFGSAFTTEDRRGRGHQLELLEERRRLTPGRHVVDVAPESTSHRNCLRAGFIDLDYRQIWQRRPGV